MKESKFSFDLLFGGVFFLFGLVFFCIGAGIGLNMDAIMNSGHTEGDPRLIPIVFMGIGGLFMIIGIPFVVHFFKKRAIRKRLLNGGYAITAKVTDIEANYAVTINGRHPQYLLCEYTDPFTCVTHVFKSGDLPYEDSSLIGMDIKVFVNRNNFDEYYVDLSSMATGKVFH